MDILTCRALYPNDTKGRTRPHQHLVVRHDEQNKEVVLVPFSSIAGKAPHVYYDFEQSKPKDHIVLFKEADQSDCSLTTPSFVNCTTSFVLNYDESVDLKQLAHRDMPQKLKQEVLDKVDAMKTQGRHRELKLNLEEFKILNPRAKANKVLDAQQPDAKKQFGLDKLKELKPQQSQPSAQDSKIKR